MASETPAKADRLPGKFPRDRFLRSGAGMANPIPLCVLWFGDKSSWEGPWIEKVLLEKIPHRTYVYPELPESDSEAVLLIFSCIQREPHQNVVLVIDRYRSVTILTLSDEKIRHDYRHYGKAKIMRPYYSPFSAWNLRTHAIPVGFHNAFGRKTGGPPENRSANRTYPWAFFGQVKNRARQEMLQNFANLTEMFGPSPTHFTSSFAASDSTSGAVIAEIFDQTYFVPCPMGNRNPDSFRVMEALERGAIPVVVRFYGLDYFKFTFGNHPFIVGKNWRDAARKCRELLENPEEISRKHHEVQEWYEIFIKELQDEFSAMLPIGSTKVAWPTPLRIRQVFQSFNPYVVFVFWLHFRFPDIRKRLFGLLDQLRSR